MTDAPTTADPIEIAMEAEAHDRSADSPARRVLLKQEKLIGWQIASERAGFVLKVLTGLAGFALGAALGLMMWQASQDRSIVVRPFNTPPACAARGLDGELLASRFMDRLQVVQRTTAANSLLSARRLSEDAAGLKVEIPRTGLSLADLQQLLVGWLGHRTVITGALSEDAPGHVSVEVRTGAGSSVRVSGTPDQLDAMMQELAVKAFAAMIPNQLSIYLIQTGRLDEGLAAARANALRGMAIRARGSDVETSGVSLWGQAEGDYRRAQQLILRAVDEAPDGRVFRRALAKQDFRLGQEDAALQGAHLTLAMKWSKGHDGFDATGRARILDDVRYVAAYLTGDFAAAAAEVPPASDLGDVAAVMHDARAWSAAVLDGEEGRLAAPDFARAAIRHAVNAGDWPAALKALEAYDLAARAWLAEPAGPGLPPRANSQVAQAQMAAQEAWRIGPLRAIALAHARRIPEARAVAERLPADCAPCLRARAVVEEAAGDHPAADRFFAAAMRVGGSSPFTEAAWGETLLARGDVKGAVVKLQGAVRKGPRFADAHAVLGEALAAAGDRKAAAASFDRAAALAPRWNSLQRRRAAALGAGR